LQLPILSLKNFRKNRKSQTNCDNNIDNSSLGYGPIQFVSKNLPSTYRPIGVSNDSNQQCSFLVLKDGQIACYASDHTGHTSDCNPVTTISTNVEIEKNFKCKIYKLWKKKRKNRPRAPEVCGVFFIPNPKNKKLLLKRVYPRPFCMLSYTVSDMISNYKKFSTPDPAYTCVLKNCMWVTSLMLSRQNCTGAWPSG